MGNSAQPNGRGFSVWKRILPRGQGYSKKWSGMAEKGKLGVTSRRGFGGAEVTLSSFVRTCRAYVPLRPFPADSREHETNEVLKEMPKATPEASGGC
jgi:hypothetical protein